MALVTCPDCHKRISDKASACPNCGCPISEMRPQLLEEENTRVEEIKAKPAHLASLREKNLLERPTAFTAMIVIQSILILLGMLMCIKGINKMRDYEFLWAVLVIFFGGLGLIYLINLYMWKKSGFWGLLVLSSINFILGISMGISAILSLLSFLWVGALYGVMQLKTHGEKVWDLLETSVKRENSTQVVREFYKFQCSNCSKTIVIPSKQRLFMQVTPVLHCRHCGEEVMIPSQCDDASLDDLESYLQVSFNG